MKTVFLSAAVASLLVSSALAQVSPGTAPRISLPRNAGFPVEAGGDDASDEAARFDLKFPGGKVKEFVAAVSKALGKPVNVVIPKETEETLIPALEMSRVTVPTLFKALSNASRHEVWVPVDFQDSNPVPERTNPQYTIVGFAFSTEEAKPSLDAVWTFQAINPNIAAIKAAVAPPRMVQYFPMAEYLTHFSVEDITTAIESGWALQGGAAQPPATIRFHEETKLLICAGTVAQIQLIPQVLKGLSQMLREPREDNLPITRKARQIIIPKLVFQDASVTEAVDYVRRKAVELDPQHQGFNIVVRLGDGAAERKITLALSEVPALEVLKDIAELAGLEMETRDHAIVLSARPLRETPAFTPVPAESFPLPGFPVPANPPALPQPRALRRPPTQ